MALPKEPRQKMINMMYLVLTAMLALNVSAEILNAFKTVNSSLEKTNTVVNTSTSTIITSFKQKLNDPANREQASLWYPKADNVVKYSKTVYDYIEGLKNTILQRSGYNPAEGDSSYKLDNLDIATRLMVDHGEGKNLLKQLTEYRNNVLNVDPEIKKVFEATLPIDLTKPKTQNKGNNTWEAAYFRMVPSVAAITILSKFQNDVKTTENRIVSYLHQKVGEVVVRFDKFKPILGQSSNYLMPGQELTVTAGVGAFNSQAQPQITIGGSNVQVIDGVGTFTTKVGSAGGGIPYTIRFIDQNGKPQVESGQIEYSVGQTSTSVALDAMNVLFIGVPNPVSIAGSGGAEKIQASMSNGNLEKSATGRYIARVQNEGDATISVTVDGKTTQHLFRVRSIPDPTPMVGQKKSGDPISASEFRSQAGVRAILENFFYQTQFNVTTYRITGEGEGFADLMEATNSGAAWSSQAQAIVNKVRNGSIITIDEIRCVGPDGRTRRLPSIVYNVR